MLAQAIRFFIFVEDDSEIQITISTLRSEIQKAQTRIGLLLVCDFVWFCGRLRILISA